MGLKIRYFRDSHPVYNTALVTIIMLLHMHKNDFHKYNHTLDVVKTMPIQ